MDKHYHFKEFEKHVAHKWQPVTRPQSRPYTIIMPPPNVTGSLHLGHALSSTLQDVLIRFKRMQGWDVVWIPGTDHAGIATQMMVEKDLAQEGKTRHDLGRDKFLERVWQWKDKYAHIIVDQMKRMGFSANWDKLCFTLDPSISEAVTQVFCKLYHKGLIYRDQRLVNWDPKLNTALSDLEVIATLEKGFLWTLRYPLVEGNEAIQVATTRPETLFGDQAIAVHPQDERYSHLVGQFVRIPLTDRVIPILADDAVDPQKGTGAVKVTPAHDFLDFEIGQRHHLVPLTIFDELARLNDQVPQEFQGMDRYTAREKVLEALKNREYFVHEESVEHTVPYSDRSGVPVEPRLTLQWFVDTQEMADRSIEAVEKGSTSFVPSEWANNYFHWLRTIRPWCISRQLWWGHRIPAWYGPEGSIFVASTEEEALALAHQEFGKEVSLHQDEDVLDTWFSSALWPFTTLGWPEKTPDLQRYYPTDVLVTGFDIIFFWVARMMMMSLEMTEKIPFRHVYIHPLIRDAQGQKMSKTKKNVVDPLELSEEYGVDALRFALMFNCGTKQHMRFSVTHVQHARNFMTKLWNVSRLLFLNDIRLTEIEPEASLEVTQWLKQEIGMLVARLTESLEEFRFQDAATSLYHFVWHIFCDKYVEFVKDSLHDQSSQSQEVKESAGWALGVILKVLHPFVPFITEHIWELMGGKESVYSSDWPQISQEDSLTKGWESIQWMDEVIGVIRRVRSVLSLPPSVKITVALYGVSSDQQRLIQDQDKTLKHMASLESVIGYCQEIPYDKKGIQVVVQDTIVLISVAHLVDISQEKERLGTHMQELDSSIKELHERLSQPDFQSKAPEEIILSLEERLAEAIRKKEAITETLAALEE
jgi:valyl-tRNA synthetase